MLRKRQLATGRVLGIAVLAAALCAGGVVAHSARAAGQRVAVAGTYVVDVTHVPTPDCKPVGGSGALLRCAVAGLVSTYKGDMRGTTTSTFTETIDCAAGRTVGQGTESFSGSVNGRTGTLRWRIAFTAKFDCTTSLPSSFKGLGTITQGSGALRGAVGALVFGDTAYAGWVR